MRAIRRFLTDHLLLDDGEAPRLMALMGLFFLVVCAVGILRPIKNALALDGLGATDFYKVYIVSAVVVLFVPAYNRAADRIAWRWLAPGLAAFFAADLIAFRVFYRPDSALLGVLFYGWYDLFAAVLVTQFFMTTQLFFNARNAKQAYPLVIAGGSLGATLGGAITGFFAEAVGTPNLLLVAAGLITAFGFTLPFVWSTPTPARQRRRERVSGRDLREIAANRHVRLIAATVLLTVLVKQLVDYQFNTLTLEAFRTPDAVSAFQGKFNAATQWLPFVVVLALRPLIHRFGVGAAVFLLPGALLVATFGLAISGTLALAVLAKAADSSLRYSAERTGREILYVPVPDAIKLKAKAYIDVAIEKGIGKVASAALIFLLLKMMEPRQISYVAVGLALLWLLVAMEIRREYVRALARSIEGRFASFRGVFGALADASTRAMLRRALVGGDGRQAAFALDLLAQADAAEVPSFASELNRLLDHESEEVRLRALAALARQPEAADPRRVRSRVSDPAPAVRQAAIRLLCTANPDRRDAILQELLASAEPAVRTAALTSVALGEITLDHARLVIEPYFEARWREADAGDGTARVELALAAGALREDARSDRLLRPLLGDPDPAVAAAAVTSAGMLARPALYPRLVDALGARATRSAAREALARQGAAVVPLLSERLLDEGEARAVRRNIPATLARISVPQSVDALLNSFIAPETDGFLDYRALKALNRLRSRHEALRFDPELVRRAVEREVGAARRYGAAHDALTSADFSSTTLPLLLRALSEGASERREGAFRALALLYPQREIHRCYLALVGNETVPRANALEWLEQTIGRAEFLRLAPVLPHRGGRSVPTAAPAPALQAVACDTDPWIARCATWTAAELGLPWIDARLDELLASPDPDVRRFAAHVRQRRGHPNNHGTGNTMDLVEKVTLLQRIDLLQGARSGHLALLASIAEETHVDSGEVLIRHGESTDSLYVVVEGAIELRGLGGHSIVAGEGRSFGTWALIDESASLVEASADRRTRLLRITRDDFHDLLADHPEIAIGMLQGLAKRVRSLVA